jgi:hypothetical protein
MLRIRIVTLTGIAEELTVDQVEFVQVCHYNRCRREFTTINPDKIYCSTSHQVMACRARDLGTIAMAIGISSTIGTAYA